MSRKFAVALAVTVALAAMPSAALAAPITASTAASTASSASTTSSASTAKGGASVQSQWVIDSTHYTYFDCDDRGLFGQLNGWWLSYYCEYNAFDNVYWLWVEYPGNPQICQTSAHAYLVYGGRAYFSGYEGSTSNGVPTVSVGWGTKVTLGGNGIKPNTTVTFRFYSADTGAEVSSGSSRTAGSNCVANENSYTFFLNAGLYLAKATYTSGNSQTTYTGHLETYVQVS